MKNKIKVQHFWNQNRKSLEKLYPGLAYNRLYREAQIFCSQGNRELECFLAQVKTGIPLEYINSQSFFYKSEFKVTRDVLIPRSETEILVEKAVQFCREKFQKEKGFLRIADMGTGSGAILLSLALDLNFPIEAWGTDLCERALAVARENYSLLKKKMVKKSRLYFCQGNLLKPLQGKFHLILSNPPYIKKRADSSKLHSQVALFEPHKALFLEDEEYDSWYEDFLFQVSHSLYPEGRFIMEGHEDHLPQIAQMVTERAYEWSFKNIQLQKDYTGRERFLMIDRL